MIESVDNAAGSRQLSHASERHSDPTPRDPRPCFLVTIDAECDDAWSRKENIATRNAGFLPRFQAFCESFTLRPTYLATFEMAQSPAFQEFGRDLLKREAGEIGMHLHAWNSLPLVPLTSDDLFYHPYLTEYPESVMRDKISFLTDLLEETFGRKMTSHRAGRWGLNQVYARMLVERGYLADCSVTPLLSWADHPGHPDQDGGPDYTRFPALPYFLDLEDISRPGTSCLLEIPVTATELGPRLLRPLRQRLGGRSVLRRGLNRLSPPQGWLAPTRNNAGLLLRVVEKSFAMNRPCVQLALHSSNLMPGGSPGFEKERDVEGLYENLHRLFSVARRKFRGATVCEFRREFTEA
jgi:hypothetical protein